MRKQTGSYLVFLVNSSANVMLFFEMQTIFYVFFEKRINFTFSVPVRPLARGGGPMRRSPAGRSVAAP